MDKKKPVKGIEIVKIKCPFCKKCERHKTLAGENGTAIWVCWCDVVFKDRVEEIIELAYTLGKAHEAQIIRSSGGLPMKRIKEQRKEFKDFKKHWLN